jgi:hypothetical protein
MRPKQLRHKKQLGCDKTAKKSPDERKLTVLAENYQRRLHH